MLSRLSALAAAVAISISTAASPAAAADQIYFSKNTNVTDILVSYINQENVRLDISSWYLSEHSISIAVANRFNAGVKVRIIGDRGAIFEADPNTKREYYWLASQGVPIRLRFNPTWFPEIDHWKAAIFVGQNVVEFGSGNFAPTELAPLSSSNFDDDSEMFTSDPDIVNAFKTKFDQMWNDTTVETESMIGGPPYLKDWNDACANEPTGNCADFHTLYPNPAPMVINTARLEPDNPIPADLIFGQGPQMNNRMIQEINAEALKVDLVAYRLEVPELMQALLDKFNAGVPVRIIVDKNQYTNILWPEYWLTHAYIDKLWAAGVPIVQNNHLGVTHLKTLITSNYATNGSSNWAPLWQRDHNYFVSKATKPAIYQAFVANFNEMWSDTTNYGPLVTTPPQAVNLSSAGTVPSPGQSGVGTTPTFTWNRAPWATSYDIYLGTSGGNMALVANVPAQLVMNPPNTYSWTPASPLSAGTAYNWKIVSRTFANMTATSDIQSFTTAGGGSSLPSPWLNQDVGSTGQPGSSTFSAGTFSVRGAGADIWGSNDAFQFAYQPLTGDGSIVARIAGIQNTNSFAKAGIMLRASVAASSQHVILDLRPTGDIEFMTRSTNGGSTSWLAGAAQAAPVWLKLARSGSTVSASISTDGSTFTPVGSTTIAFPGTIDAGLLVSSHDTSTLNTSTFDSVTVTSSGSGSAPGAPTTPSPANSATGISTTPTLSWSSSGATSYDVAFGTSNPPPTVSTGQAAASYTPSALANGTTYFWRIVARNSSGSTTGPVWSFTTGAGSTLPSPWQNQDVGATGQPGSSTFNGGTFTVRGAGADIWGTSDAFQFTYQSLTGDGQIVARVASIQNTGGSFAKAGIMLRASVAANSQHVILDLRPTGDIEFMTRSANGGSTSWLSGAAQAAPVWLKLVRSGSTVTGSISTNGSTWTQVGSTTITFPSSITAGLLVTSHDTSTLNTSTFDSVTVSTAGGSAPGAPASPSPANAATGVSTAPTLSWSASGATSYDVAFGTSTPPPTVSTGQASASYAPPSLTGSTTYFWQIIARNGSGSTTGPLWSFTTAGGAPPVPGAPGNPNPPDAAGNVGTSPTLTWTSANATSYDVKFGTTNPPPQVSTGQASASYSTTGLTNGMVYFWQIVAKNSSGSTAGPIWAFTASGGASAPGTPVNPSPPDAANTVSTSPTLTWTSAHATSYDVKFGTTNPPPAVSSGQASASYTPPALSANTTYFWQIVARNGSGSTTGSVWSFTTAGGAPPVPGTPGNPNPTNGASGASTSPTLTWTAANATSYDVKFGTTNPPPQVSTGQAHASYSAAGLNSGTVYFWQIVAKNSSGSTSGPVWSFTTSASVSPTNIVIYAADIPPGNFHGGWTPAGDATAAASVAALTPDGGLANTSAPLASPAQYVDVTFGANAGVAYTLWIRVKAAGNSKLNDSFYVQFSDALAGTSPVYQLNSTNGLVVNLATDTTGSSLSNWGWVNGAYWLSQPATLNFASSGTHTLRIQTREDGVQFDQIVLSPSQYFNGSASCPTSCGGAPGPVANDSTIVPKP
jgi:regulation of enolase protein 1 (concanavalin A-like superfamily)